MNEEHDEGVRLYDVGSFQAGAAILWAPLRTWMKVYCNSISHFKCYVEWPIHAAKVCFLHVSAWLEIPLFLPAAVVGFAFACVTGTLALTILSVKTVWVFRKIAPSVIEALALRLWYEGHQSVVGLFKNMTIYLWTLITRAIKLGQFYKDSVSPPPEPSEDRSEMSDYSRSITISNDQDDGMLKTDFESLGGWKISETLHESESTIIQNEDLYIAVPQGQIHRRTGSGSSLRLSGASSPELVRTPLQMANAGRDRGKRRGSGSGTSSPESYFRMTSRTDANGSGSVLGSNKHSRSGSSSTSSLRSAGKRST